MIEIFKGIEKSTFVHLVTVTEVKMVQKDRVTKEPNPYHNRVTKKLSGNFLIGNDYEKRVITNDTKEGGEGNFEVKENWFEHVTKCVVKSKKTGEFYLQYEYFKESNPKVEFEFEGNPIDKMLFENYLNSKSEPTNQPQERKVYYQTYKMDSIKEFSLNGTKYQVQD